MRDNRMVLLRLPEVSFAESEGNDVWLSTDQGRLRAASPSLDKLDGELADAGFLRVHRRYVVNLSRIREIERGLKGELSLVMDDRTNDDGAGLPAERAGRAPRAGHLSRDTTSERRIPVSDSPDALAARRTRQRGAASASPPRPDDATGPAAGGEQPRAGGRTSSTWTILRKHPAAADPMGEDFDYAAAFAPLDLDALARDVDEVLTTSQDWWPADFGHYGPLVVRMAWHCAGTYRVADGRGGAGRRHAALRAAEQLAGQPQPRQGAPAALAGEEEVRPHDLLGRPDGLRGQPRPGDDGLHDLRLRRRPGGRLASPTRPSTGVPSAPGSATSATAASGSWTSPLAADQMGLIYVNPEGPNTVPDPLMSARDIRETFRRMGMNDEETVALIVGGHTFGKTHGAADPERHLGPEPEGAPLEEQGLGWRSGYGTGKGADTITSGLDGTWTPTPTRWDNSYLETLFGYEWDVALSPAGLWQWVPRGRRRGRHRARRPRPVDDPRPDVPDDGPRAAGRPGLRADLAALPGEPGPAGGRLRPGLVQADAPRHGPDPALPRTAGPPGGAALAGPGPRRRPRAGRRRTTSPRSSARSSPRGLSVAQLVATAWASASTFRISDRRGGANGARIRLEPQRGWEVNDPDTLAQVLRTLEGIQESFNGARTGGRRISLADLIVLGGAAAVEQAARNAGPRRLGPVHPGTHGRDAGADRCGVLRRARADRGRVPQLPREGQPAAVGAPAGRPGEPADPERARDDRPGRWPARAGRELRAVPAGRPHLDARVADQRLLREPARHGHGVDGRRPDGPPETFEGRDRATGEVRWTASRVDLVFGSNSELRAARGGLRERRRAGEVRARLRGRVGQGHEPRPVRPRLILCRVRPGSRSGGIAGTNGSRWRTNGTGRPESAPTLVGVIRPA